MTSRRPDLMLLLARYEETGEVASGEELQAAMEVWLERMIAEERRRYPGGKPALFRTRDGCERLGVVPVPAPPEYKLPLRSRTVGAMHTPPAIDLEHRVYRRISEGLGLVEYVEVAS